MLGDKLSAVTALSVPVRQTPALARTLIKASLHCAPGLRIPPLIGSVGLFLTEGHYELKSIGINWGFKVWWLLIG